jgi:hypothetical protein
MQGRSLKIEIIKKQTKTKIKTKTKTKTKTKNNLWRENKWRKNKWRKISFENDPFARKLRLCFLHTSRTVVHPKGSPLSFGLQEAPPNKKPPFSKFWEGWSQK